MQTPSQAEVLQNVKWFISGYTHIPPEKIEAEWELKGPELSFDEAQLGFLAMSLRGYVQHYNPDATVLAKETRQSGQTVKSLAALIYEKSK